MTMTAGDLSTRLATEYRPLLMRLDLVARRQSTHYTLSRAQTSILSTLARHGDLRMSDLARLENVRVPTTSNSVSVVESMGLVERVPHAGDGRGVCVRLTDQGRARIEEVLEQRNRDLAERISALPEEYQEALSGAVPALHALLDTFDESDAPRDRSAH